MANKPNNPSLWSKAKSLAKQKFDVYPSAYANGWAAKWYKGKGGTWRKAEYGMEIPYMEEGGKPEWLIKAQLEAQGFSGNALQQKMSSMAQGGEKMPPEIARARFAAAGNLDKMADYGYAYGGYIPEMMYGGYKFMDEGGEANGEMALGQMAAVSDKMAKLLQFVKPDDNLDPWIASKLAVMDHSADAISDYMMYGAEGDEEEEMEDPEGLPMPEMKNGGGIPERYKNMGFTKVGVKKNSTRPGKKWMVLAKKGDQYKVVHGGYDGMKDFSQHGSEKRKTNFWNRMGGKNSSKATDPFSPLYWHKKFGTWEEGGEVDGLYEMKNGGSTWSGNAFYQTGGEPQMQDYPDYGSWKSAYDNYMMTGSNPDVYMSSGMAAAPVQTGAPSINYSTAPREQDFPDYETYAAALDNWMAQTTANAAPVTAPQIAIPPVQAPVAQKATAAPINYAGVSIVDLLSSVGKASDYNSRKQLAAQLGIDNYYGSAQQNLQLVKMIVKSPDVLSDYKPSAKPGGPSKPRTSNASASSSSSAKSASKQTAAASKASSDIFSPEFAAQQKKAYLSAHPDMTEEQYNLMVMPRNSQATIGPATKPMAPRTREQEIADQASFNKFWSEYDKKRIDEDILRNGPLVDRTNQMAFNNAMLDFFTKEVPLTVATSAVPFVRWGTKIFPYGQRMIPEVVNASRRADRALPYATRALPGIPKQMGGEYEEYKNGGISIDPKKRGTFKAQATKMGMSVQQAAKTILNAPEGKYSPAMRKKANFARNFAKQMGGLVEGAEMEVTPEQLAMLKAQGYKFEII